MNTRRHGVRRPPRLSRGAPRGGCSSLLPRSGHLGDCPAKNNGHGPCDFTFAHHCSHAAFMNCIMRSICAPPSPPLPVRAAAWFPADAAIILIASSCVIVAAGGGGAPGAGAARVACNAFMVARYISIARLSTPNAAFAGASFAFSSSARAPCESSSRPCSSLKRPVGVASRGGGFLSLILVRLARLASRRVVRAQRVPARVPVAVEVRDGLETRAPLAEAHIRAVPHDVESPDVLAARVVPPAVDGDAGLAAVVDGASDGAAGGARGARGSTMRRVNLERGVGLLGGWLIRIN